MIQRLNLHMPLNSLSLGGVSFNILRELYRRKIQCALFPYGSPDLAAYKLDDQFGKWIETCVNNRYKKVDRSVPTLAVWHLAESQFKPSDRQYLLSFVETDSPTDAEINIANQQNHTFFTSSWTVNNFQIYGAANTSFVPLGLDEDFKPSNRRLIPDDQTHWVLVGKAESRKNTEMIIKTWCAKYGGKKEHLLTLAVTNPFYKKEQMEAFYFRCFDGKPKPFNVNILPYLKTNAEMNSLYNSADIDLSGFSRAEGWGLPSFTATALGKWSIVTNCTAHKDWATADNSILVEPVGMKPCYDGVFFNPNQPFNQGNFYDFTSDQLVAAMEQAEKVARIPNLEGLKLAEKFTYKNTVDTILAKIEADSV